MGEILELKNTEITEENDELVFLTPMDIAKAMDCSVPTRARSFTATISQDSKSGRTTKC